MHEGHAEHTHPHGHHEAGQAGGGQEKALAMLKYMLEHNRHHAEETRELAGRIESARETGAERLIIEAASLFDEGNEKLSAALGLLEGRRE